MSGFMLIINFESLKDILLQILIQKNLKPLVICCTIGISFIAVQRCEVSAINPYRIYQLFYHQLQNHSNCCKVRNIVYDLVITVCLANNMITYLTKN